MLGGRFEAGFGDEDIMKIGMAVRARIITEDQQPLLVFEPAGA